MVGIPSDPMNGPLRLSDIKYSVYGGLKFNRVLSAGWSFHPSLGLVAKEIDRLGLQFENFEEPLHMAAAYMGDSFKRNFEVGGRPEPWEPLAEYTTQVRGNSGPILIRSGNLLRAATSFSIWTFTPTSMSIQQLPTFAWYGVLHQQGYGSLSDIARKELGAVASARDVKIRALELLMGARSPSQHTKTVIPQREFILFQVEDVEAIQEIFINWMEDLAEEVGRSWNQL
jgi:phage gpG-like protein